MSAIAQQKAEKRKSIETTFLFMGITFLTLDFVIVILIIIASSGLNRTNMTPLIYFLILAGLSFGMGSYLKEHNFDSKYFKNWLYGFLFIGILIGAILGAIQW